jgi:predicted O-methyltransferase YrrM
MTTRETTPLLTRSWDVSLERGYVDWLWLLGIGAIQWPWLLKSLYGGRKRDKAALLQNLGLPNDALPNLGSWKADVGLLMRLANHVATHRPETVVELGSGASTLVLAKAMQRAGIGRLVSFDQHADFVEETREWVQSHGLTVDMRHAPLVSSTGQWRDLWYDLKDVPERIDLLVIDGPPWTIHPFVRSAADVLFERVVTGGTIILDDAARPGERLIWRTWRARWPQFEWSFEPSIKGRLVGRRK